MPCSFLPLFINIHRHAGLEFNGEFVLVDGDFFNQTPDKRLAVLGQVGGLLPQEGAHVGDALFLFVPPGAFQLKLLFIFTQAVNILGDVLIVGSGTGPLQKLLLQFGQPRVDIGKWLAFFGFQNGFNVLLQGGEEGVLVAPCLINGGDQYLFDLAFRYSAGVAE